MGEGPNFVCIIHICMNLRIALFTLAFFWLLGCAPVQPGASNQKNRNMAENKDWIRSTNVYEVNVRQYTKEGTFRAFLPELPRLRDMGVQTLWFMPITPIAQKGKKGSLG